MKRTIVALLALVSAVAPFALIESAVAQDSPAASAPEPKMPPMPSMEGQQGDVSKPVTQIPSHKKAAVVEKKTPPKAVKPAVRHKKR